MKDTLIKTERLLQLAQHLRRHKQYEAVDSSAALPSLRIHENGSVMRYLDFPFFECAHIFDE